MTRKLLVLFLVLGVGFLGNPVESQESEPAVEITFTVTISDSEMIALSAHYTEGDGLEIPKVPGSVKYVTGELQKILEGQIERLILVNVKKKAIETYRFQKAQ